MKKIVLVFIILFSIVFIGKAIDVYDYKDDSAAQLSGMEDYVTLPNTSYWNTHAYKQIYDIKEYLLRNLNVSELRQRNVVDYSSIMAAVHDSAETLPQSGLIIGPPNRTDVIRDTTIWLANNMQFEFPAGYKLDWDDLDRSEVDGDFLFKGSLDTNIVISGGEFYGNSDQGFVSLTVVTATTLLGVGVGTVSGVDVVADSMVGWRISQFDARPLEEVPDCAYIIAGNGDTDESGHTTIELTTDWCATPDPLDVLYASWMHQFHYAIGLYHCNNVRIENTYIHDFPGDAIDIAGGEHIYIHNNRLITPAVSFAYGNGIEHLIGRQGISITGFDSTAYAVPTYGFYGGIGQNWPGTAKNIIISSNEIEGSYAGIDIEPNGRVYVENILIDGNLIKGSARGIAITTGNARMRDIVISNNVIDSTNIAIDLFASIHADSTVDTRRIFLVGNRINYNTYGMLITACDELYVIGNTFINTGDSTSSSRAIELSGRCSNIVIADNVFINSYYTIMSTYATNTDITVTGNIVINPGVTTSNMITPFTFSNNQKVTFKDNVIYANDLSGNYLYAPATFSSCDSVLTEGNSWYGNFYLDNFSFDATTNYISKNNYANFSAAQELDGGGGSAGYYGYELMLPNFEAYGAYRDTVLTDSTSQYRLRFFGDYGVDTLIWVNDNLNWDSLMVTAPLDTVMTIYNDTLYIHSSDTLTADSVSITKLLLGVREDFAPMGIGRQVAAGVLAREHWYTWPTYRDVLNADYLLGVLLRVPVYSGYALSASQRAEVELYANRDDLLTTHAGDVVRAFRAVGGKLYPENLILPSDTVMTHIDGSSVTVAVDTMACFFRADTLWVKTTAGWRHVEFSSGVTP